MNQHSYKLSDNTVYMIAPEDAEQIKFVTDLAKKNKLGLVNETTGEVIIKVKESKQTDDKSE